MSDEKRRKPPLKSNRPEIKAQALQLLAGGETVAGTARALKQRENTVRDWRDSPDGQRTLAEARTKRAADLANASTAAKRLLEDNATLAAQTLVDGLRAKAPTVRVASARALLDRVGVPVVREVKATVTQEGVDLSRLSTDELVRLDELMRRARGEA